METDANPIESLSTASKPFYRRRWFISAAVIVAVPVIAAAWYLGSPLFLNKTVVEAFPAVTTSVATGDSESAPTSTEAPAAETQAAAESDDSADDQEAPTGEDAAPQAGPVAVLSGSFAGADSNHQGEGSVTVYELEDGSRILRFEGLDVTNGPDLHVIVSPVADPQSRDDVSSAGYIDLGSLKGNRGDQNYDIPPDFDLSQAASIVIYCKPFHVIFATATLGQA